MNSDILTALIAGLFSVIGSASGVMATSKLTNYRLQQLENKVDGLLKKNDEIVILQEQMKGVLSDVKDLKAR